MGSESPARCSEHGLAVGPDGRCVLCRRSEPTTGPRTPRPRFASKLLSWRPAAKVAEAAAAVRRSLPIKVMASPVPTAEPISIKATQSSKSPAPDPEEEWMLRAGFLKAPPVPSFEPELPAAAARVVSKISARPPAPRASSPRPPRELSIVLYGIASCSVCQAAQRHLESKGLKYVVHDVARDSAAAARALSLNPRRTVPTIDLGGREVLLGFSPEEFDAALIRALVPTAKPTEQ